MARLVALAVLLCLAAPILVAADGDCDLMLVVGHVGEQEARLLVALPVGSPSESVTVELRDASGSIVASDTISASEVPRMVAWKELGRGERHSVRASRFSCSQEHTASFRTLSGIEEDLDFAVVSCNRIVEDGDSSMWERLAESQAERQATIHLGDQIYADHIPRYTREAPELTYCSVLSLFRSFYWTSWTAPSVSAVLRGGANYMLPDDHEVANNLDHRMWTPGFFAEGKERGSDSEQLLSEYLMRAGIQTFYEYQQQLNADCNDWLAAIHIASGCPSGSQNLADLDHLLADERRPRLHFSLDLPRSTMLFLDARLERTLALEEENPLFGAAQLRYAEEEIARVYGDERVSELLLFTSVPLLYQDAMMAEVAYVFEGERYPSHRSMQADALPLLSSLVHSDGYEKATVIAGDLHMYYRGHVCSEGRCIRSLVTSGMTATSTALNSAHLLFYNWLCFFASTGSMASDSHRFTATFEEVFLHNNFLLLHIGADGSSSWSAVLADLPSNAALKHSLVLATPTIVKAMATLTGAAFAACLFLL